MRKNVLWIVFLMVCLTSVYSADPPEAPEIKKGSGEETPGVAKAALDGPMQDVEEVVFAVRRRPAGTHWYDNMGRCFKGQYNITKGFNLDNTEGMTGGTQYWLYPETGGGRLSAVNVRTGKVRDILNDPEGNVRDPFVHYDGKTILFSYRKGGTHRYHLYEIQSDGTGLKQLTSGDYDDIEAIYLPNDEIMFVSTRGDRFTPCNANEAGILFRCDREGENMRCISLNQEFDNTPWVLNDGRVSYLRWEYFGRDLYKLHNLWVFNPDGTKVMTLWGNSRSANNGATLDAKPIPGSDKIVMSRSTGHGQLEHCGVLEIIDPNLGPDDPDAIRQLSPRAIPDHPKAGSIEFRGPSVWRDPWAFSEDAFMTASWQTIYVMNGKGEYETLYKIADQDPNIWVHEPRPLMAREREPIIPDMVNFDKHTGTMALSAAHITRHGDSLEEGSIKEIMIMEIMPLAVTNNTVEPQSGGSNYFPMQCLGTVPVEADGSAFFEVPVGRAVAFATLDKEGVEVQRMLSFTGSMPGEYTGCVGCHENRTRTTEPAEFSMLLATKRPPSKIEPFEGVPSERPIDFMKDVQPVFDKHCVSCHNSEKYGETKLILEDWRVGAHPASYTNLMNRGFVSWSDPGGDLGGYAPYELANKSKLTQMLKEDEHHGVKLAEGEKNVLRAWESMNGPFSGTLGIIRSNWKYSSPRPKISKDILKKRCYDCHITPTWGNRNEPSARTRAVLGECYVTDPHHPEMSVLLRAPLAKEAGGLGLCKAIPDEIMKQKKAGGALLDCSGFPSANVFKDTTDPDYQAMLASLKDLSEKYQANPPDKHVERIDGSYLKEMLRLEVMDPAQIEKASPFEIDQAYYESVYEKYYPPFDAIGD